IENEELRGRLDAHVRRFFSAEASAAYAALDLHFAPYGEACTITDRTVVIPTDGAGHRTEAAPWQVAFNGTRLTLWHRLAMPQGDEWTAVPGPDAPLWYVRESGTVMPAWDLADVLCGLLDLREESETSRDKHGRALASDSPRHAAGLLEVPAFNEAAAALVALAMAAAPVAATHLPAGALRPPTLVLSHDVDVLMGNDFWGQFMRLGGVLAPLARLRPPNPVYLRLIGENRRDPRRYYLDDIARMVEIERQHGYRSAFYFLVGKRGLYGPRYGLSAVREAMESIPPEWVAGIHHSYYSYLRDDSFTRDMADLEALIRHAPVSGRAHYLRHDPGHSPAFLARFGLAVDESLGYPDAVGYRAGIAGPYEIPGVRLPDGRPMIEMPLVVMDGPLLDYDDPLGTFERLLRHLTHVGGALSLLTHPGTMDNPQRPRARGLYAAMLGVAASMGVTGVPAESFLDGGGEAE
ncbi:MAG: polysaccharide deacetylase family protein, partial [Coriobacteriia bacterium]